MLFRSIEVFPYTNTAPVLAAIPNQTVNAGATLALTNAAIDADIPADTLTFTLTSWPAGATITPAGVFSWTAPQVLSPQTNSVTVRVADNGSPSLNNSKSFTIAVVPPPRVLSGTFTNGGFKLTWSTYPGKTYRVQFKDDLNTYPWTTLGSDSVAAGYALSLNDTNPSSRQRFYRVVQVNPT